MSSPGKEANILNLEQKIARLEQQLLFEKTELSGYGLTGNFKREAIVSTINQLRSKIKNIKAVETERRLKYAYQIRQNSGYVSESDSLVLVALYDSTRGKNWTYNDNWKTTPVNQWYGITVADSVVTSIKLSDNNLQGNLPDTLGNLIKLDTLDLSSNQLSGSISPQLGNLSMLHVLNLSYNQLTGSIPSELGNLSDLTRLLLYSNQLSGSIPPEIGSLLNLRYLYLHHNELNGSIPPELGNLSGLEYLELSSNQLTDTIPSELGNLSNLRNFFLSSNLLAGNIPAELGNLVKLENLSLPSNQLTGTIPVALTDLTNLYYLDLSSNQLTGSIPSEIKRLSKLSFLSIASNQLTDALPREIGDLINLNYLFLSDNQFTDTIPPEIGQLSNLNYLYLSGNLLRGNVPQELGELSSLTNLSLVDNKFNGMVPLSIGNLTNLKGLYLSSNRFSGLPDLSFLQLDNFWVDHNFFTFEDLEPNMHIASVEMRYEPQNPVGDEISRSIAVGTPVSLKAQVGGNHNHYQWFKNNIELISATDSVYIIKTFSASDAGTYICMVTNDSVPGLTIETAPATLMEELGFTVTFVVSDGTNPITGAIVTLGTYGNDTTDTEGIISFMNVTHGPRIPYSIAATGYDTLVGNVTVIDKDTIIQITMLATGFPVSSLENITVYPNPVHDVLYINCDKCYYIEVFDITGKRVSGMKNKYEINLSGLKEGIYFLRLKNKNNSTLKTIRIVKK
jgi:Leucine-rich repeat (LRR) protein